ncbi:unnamed protein product [Pylaiella littoralis]
MAATSLSQDPLVASSPPPIVHALSGSVGAVVAMTLLYPLDQVRAILQVDDELAKECSAPGGAGVLGALSRIVQRHGKAGLWRGMVPVLITMGVSNFVYFYCFNGMKAALLARRRLRGARAGAAIAKVAAAAASGARINSSVLGNTALAKPLKGLGGGAGGGSGSGSGQGLTPLESVVASTIAGVVNVLATTPLWVSNLRIKAGNGVGGLFSTLGSIGRHEGLSGLWSGTAPSLVLVSNPIIQFVVYEALKQAAGRRHSQLQHQHITETCAPRPDTRYNAAVGGGVGTRPSVGLPSREAFLLGATAKAISTLVTYPLQLAQAKLRAGQAQAKGPCQGNCAEQNRISSPDDVQATAVGASRMRMVWQLLTCWTGTVDVLASVYRHKGVSGMYQGMQAKLLHTVLTSAFLFLGYERLVEVIATSMATEGEASPPPRPRWARPSPAVPLQLPIPRSGSAVAL